MGALRRCAARRLHTIGLLATGLLTIGLTAQAIPAAGSQGAAPASVPVVRLAFPRDDGTLTPYTFELGYPLVTLVYDTLLWRDEDGVPQPWLARSVDQDADGKRITLRLADGAAWHDGAPVTSADVAFTFDYVKSHPHPRFSPQLVAVERVETPDPRTAVVVLRDRSPGFFDQPLADLPILPAHLWRSVPPNQLAPDGLPVGSGPYRLVEHRTGERYVLEANADYFAGAPSVQRLEVPFIADAPQTFSALERRRVDMIAVSLPAIPTQRFERLGTRVQRGPSYLGTVVMFNLRRPPFDRVEARRAVADALDLDRIARLVDRAVPADRGYLHPDSPWSSTLPPKAFSAVPAGAGLGELAGTVLRVLVADNDPVRREAGEQVVLALRRRGIDAQSELVPAAQLSAAVGEDGAQPSFDLAIWTSPPLASYDPDFLGRVFGSDPETAPLNFSGYRSEAFDELMRRIATEPDRAARQELVDQALALLQNDVPVAPLFFPVGAYAFRPAVFDRWVFVKGSGILDKRSFLAPAADARPTSQPPTGHSSGGFPLGLAALGVLGLAVGVAVAGSATSHRRR